MYFGLMERVITSHIGVEPKVSQIIQENQCLGYAVSLGAVTELFRAAASHRPGVFTSSGLATFLDPRLEGGKLNSLTRDSGEDIVFLKELDGKEWLYYPVIPVDVAIVRGTYADEDGNIAMDKEAVSCDAFEAAAAAHNNGGIVIAQVEHLDGEIRRLRQELALGLVDIYADLAQQSDALLIEPALVLNSNSQHNIYFFVRHPRRAPLQHLYPYIRKEAYRQR